MSVTYVAQALRRAVRERIRNDNRCDGLVAT